MTLSDGWLFSYILLIYFKFLYLYLKISKMEKKISVLESKRECREIPKDEGL